MRLTFQKWSIWCLCLCLLLTACGAGLAEEPAASAPLVVVSTIFAPYDFVRQVAGDKVALTMLLPPASESHSYEPTPQDIIAIQNCDVFLYVGGESDAWVSRLLDSMDTSRMRIITLMDCVETVTEEIVEGMEDDHEAHPEDEEHEDEEHGDEEHEGEEHEGEAMDEHVWTSPRNAARIVARIADVLGDADSANAVLYQQNAATYKQALADLDAAFQAAVDGGVRKTLVFGDRFPFRYFAAAYGLTYFAAFPGCSTETEPSASTVAFLVDKVRAEGIPVVFHVELSNRRMATTIAEETGAKVLLLHACHNVSKAEFEGGATYLSLMTQNLANLKEALR